MKLAKFKQNFQFSKNHAWALVLLGGFVEMFWVSGLKYSTLWWHHALTALGIFISFNCMIFAIKRIEVGIAYSVFVGIGTAGIVIAEIVVFGESASMMKIFLIFTLICGVLGLKLATSKEEAQAKGSKSGTDS